MFTHNSYERLKTEDYEGLLSRIGKALTHYGLMPTNYNGIPDEEGCCSLDGSFYKVHICPNGTLSLQGNPRTSDQWRTLTDIVGFANNSKEPLYLAPNHLLNEGFAPSKQTAWENYMTNLNHSATGKGFFGNLLGVVGSTLKYVTDLVPELFGGK